MSLKEAAEKIFENTGMTLLWLTVALLAAGIILGVLIFKFKREKFGDFKKYAFGLAAGYAIAVIVVMTFLKFQYNAFDADLEHNLVEKYLVKPILSMVLIPLIGAIIASIAAFFSKKAIKIIGIMTAVAELGAFIATMVFMNRYYEESAIIKDWYPSLNTAALIGSAAAVILIIAVIYLLGAKRKNENNTKELVYGAVAIAMSFALSYIRLFHLPQGGSVTFASLLPIMIYCCMFGTRRGVIACLIYGVLQAIQDPWIIHPVQFLLDYPLAFGCVGISGLFMEREVFKNKKVLAFLLGSTIAVLLRYACHICSGIFAFADYADLEKYDTALAYSFGYNSFTLVDMLISAVAGTLLFASKSFTSQMARSSASAKSAQVFNADDDENDDIPTSDNITLAIDGIASDISTVKGDSED